MRSPFRNLLPMVVNSKHLVLIPILFIVMSLVAGRAAAAPPCEVQTFETAEFIVCTVTPARDDLRLFWKDAHGEPYRRFPAIAKAVADEGHRLIFALNGGMYRTDFSPIGLYVEDGRELRPLSTKTIDGPPGKVPNFYKQPNGVFFLNNTDAGILPTGDLLKHRPKARYATQSGPMLVFGNKLNPIFIAGSTDRTRRSGVGVCDGGSVRFAISEDAVNFHDFARLFRDHLKCPNALFLDGGNGVGIYEPDLGRSDISWHGGFGPVIGLIE